MSFSISRRNMLRMGAVLGAAPLASHLSSPAVAEAVMPAAQVPYFYRFRLGEAAATMVSDGPLPIGEPSANFANISPQEVTSMLAANFLPTDNMVLEQNTLVINLNGKTVIFDNGMGQDKTNGDTPGKLMLTLKQAGIDPAGIDAVVMSHAHVDHCGGIVAADGSLNFPNAQYYISQADFEFWTDPNNPVAGSRDQARRNLLPVRDRLVFVSDGEEFLPGVTAILAPGHTVGHMMYMIRSGNEQLCYIGDLTHHSVLLMERPLTEFVYDTDAKQSAQTRVKMLTMFADEKIPILAYHFAWPGIGHVSKFGEGFHFVPKPMELMTVG